MILCSIEHLSEKPATLVVGGSLERDGIMITKNDCLLLLTEMNDRGIDTREATRSLVKGQFPTVEIIKFINDNRQLDLTRFYKKIRKSYNEKHSTLYVNIVKDIDNVSDVLTTLSALETQILLFARDVEDREMFLRHSRAEEISRVLTNYFQTYDLTNCIKLLRMIKADIKTLESIC